MSAPVRNPNLPDTTLSAQVDPKSGQAIFNSPSFGIITGARVARFLQIVARI
jgi:hypothetical protein